MAQFLVIVLIFINVFVALVMASEEAHQVMTADLPKAEAPINRKLGKHQQNAVLGPSDAHQNEDKVNKESTSSSGHQNEDNSGIEGHEVDHSKHHHSSVDKSVAGGGMILGGLATTFFVAIFCYIKATRRHQAQTSEA